MRRIYDSGALCRDDGPFTPTEGDTEERPQSMRSIDSSAWSRRLVPNWLRHRAISIDVSTPRTEYAAGDAVPFTVTMKNAMPFPITLRAVSPVLWTWDVDGVREASHVSLRDPPEEERGFAFERGERKRFTRRWQQMFRVSDSEWERAGPGEYTVGAGINVDNAAEKGLYAETTVRVVEE
jgi:hypothetical protein